MNLIFAGTPEFARVALESLHAAGFEVVLVLSQPDRPAGRGMKLQASAVKQFAQPRAIPVMQPRSLRLDGKYPDDAAAAREALRAADADAMVVAAYGLILPQWVLDAMEGSRPDGSRRLGCLNIHASLLPRWRGAAPIHRAIEAGDTETGITIMQMDAGLDTGAMLLVEKIRIAADDSTGSLQQKLADLGGRLILQALEAASRNGLSPVDQSEIGVTYAHKVDKKEAAIDWSGSAKEIDRRIRAFDPFPGAVSMLQGETIKFWRAAPVEPETKPGSAAGSGSQAGPGTIIAVEQDCLLVASGLGQLRVTELQRPGGKRLPVRELLRGFPIQPGMRFERPPS